MDKRVPSEDTATVETAIDEEGGGFDGEIGRLNKDDAGLVVGVDVVVEIAARDGKRSGCTIDKRVGELTLREARATDAAALG